MAEMEAHMEPLPLVPATWMAGHGRGVRERSLEMRSSPGRIMVERAGAGYGVVDLGGFFSAAGPHDGRPQDTSLLCFRRVYRGGIVAGAHSCHPRS